jgi:hypothetical protein
MTQSERLANDLLPWFDLTTERDAPLDVRLLKRHAKWLRGSVTRLGFLWFANNQRQFTCSGTGIMCVRRKNELFRLSSGKAVVFSFRLDDTTRHTEMFESSAGPAWPGSFSVLCDKHTNNMKKFGLSDIWRWICALPLSLIQEGGPSEGRIARSDSQSDGVLGIGLHLQLKSQWCSDDRN